MERVAPANSESNDAFAAPPADALVAALAAAPLARGAAPVVCADGCTPTDLAGGARTVCATVALAPGAVADAAAPRDVVLLPCLPCATRWAAPAGRGGTALAPAVACFASTSERDGTANWLNKLPDDMSTTRPRTACPTHNPSYCAGSGRVARRFHKAAATTPLAHEHAGARTKPENKDVTLIAMEAASSWPSTLVCVPEYVRAVLRKQPYSCTIYRPASASELYMPPWVATSRAPHQSASFVASLAQK